MKFYKRIKKEWKNIIFNVIFAIITLLIVILFYKQILLLTILLIGLAIIGLIKWSSKLTILLFIMGGIFGTLAESIAINYGVWQYSLTNLFNVPLWLIIVWGNAAAFIYQPAVEIKTLGVKK